MNREAMTIVVPVKNRATLVLRTLASIKAQTWRPLRVVVVDNGSTDGTPQSVAAWMDANRAEGFDLELLEEPRPGAAVARNAGLQAVDSRLMMFFDSDDRMQPRHVEKIMKRFHAGDDPDMVFFRVNIHPIDGEDRITKRGGRNLMLTHIFHSVARTQGYACETALARRAGGWDEETHCWDDLEFGARMLLEARRRVFIPDVNVDVYAQVDSITGTEFSSRRGQWELVLDKMERNFERSGHPHRDKWRRALAYKRVILAASYRKEGARDAAEALLAEALAHPLLNSIQRAYLRAAYRYTALGGRGAAILAPLLL